MVLHLCDGLDCRLLFTHTRLRLSQSLEMFCKAGRIAFSSASCFLQCCPHAQPRCLCESHLDINWMVRPILGTCSTGFNAVGPTIGVLVRHHACIIMLIASKICNM